MRLLEQKNGGELSLTKDIIDNIPPYAILSHRWLDESEEPSFEDLINGIGQNKAGYDKLRFCGEQARQDSLQYFWVDTCCIDKSSSAKLTEAINSMFRWYQEAAKCYVYLADVSIHGCDRSDGQPAWESAFRDSTWFNRGWTLQELVAPALVEFFSFEKVKLGDKSTMEQQISEITGITAQALRNVPLSDFSVEDRQSWAARRKTTRGEDKAYSLQGILDVFMPTIYGEGEKNAFTRLRAEIKRSEKAKSRTEPKWSQDKRLAEIYQWLLPPDPSLNYQKAIRQRQDSTGQWFLDSEQYKIWRTNSASLIWLYGIPGCGKSILSSTILENTLQYCSESPGKSYLILDALDECSERAELMQVIERIVEWKYERLHLLVTSRKEREIEVSLEDIVDDQNMISLEREIVDKDIQKYIRERLANDKGLRKWQNDPGARIEIEKTLMVGAHGMFRWAACQLDTLGKRQNQRMLRKALKALPNTLNDTYERMLCSIDEEVAEYAVRVLRWFAFCGQPLSVEEISEVVAIDTERDPPFDREEVLQDPLDVLSICSSLVVVTTVDSHFSSSSTGVSKVVALAHYSVKEYLTSDRICLGSAARYSTKESFCNEFLAKGCLGYLHQFKEDGCLSSETIQNFSLAQYSARFWIAHVQASLETESLNRLVMKLFSSNGAYLNWVRVCDLDMPWQQPGFRRTFATVPPPVYYASLGGLTGVVEQLLAKGADVNAQGGYLGNALQAASARRHEKVVEQLLAKGADVNALQAASAIGHEKVVELLLGKGADVNAQGGGYGNALQAASHGGHGAIVELLLGKGAGREAAS